MGLLVSLLLLFLPLSSGAVLLESGKQESRISPEDGFSSKSYIGLYLGDGCFDTETGLRCLPMRIRSLKGVKEGKRYLVREIYLKGKLYDAQIEPVDRD
ncbi:hypothetical protein [Thermovibrio sp.]